MQSTDEQVRQVRFQSLDSTVAILGAGFSVPAGVPPTNRLSGSFLDFDRGHATPTGVQQAISRQLRRFWEEVFSYRDGQPIPSFEDHFTLLDLSANAGHNLGHDYTPSLLRAVRRISIHRVFDVLDRFRTSGHLSRLLDRLASSRESAIVSLNWDVVVENHLHSLGYAYHYDVPGRFLNDEEMDVDGFPLVKLHGAANWHYCDSCQAALFGFPGAGKTALHHLTFLEPKDLRALGEPDAASELGTAKPEIPCPRCSDRQVTARVATFSYAKAFDFFPFHAAWNAARRRLMAARRWIFIGYSFPEADFAFRNLLKAAQMTGLRDAPKDIWVVLYDDAAAADRYRRFFGIGEGRIYQCGLEGWVDERLLPDPRRGHA